MGHHKSYCAVTHTPIRERCVAIWTKTSGSHMDCYSGDLIDSIAIRGVTDTYMDIEPDEDQKHLVDHLTPEQLENRPSLFVDELVYDKILTIGISDFGDEINSGTAEENGSLSVYNLTLLGFVLQPGIVKHKKDETVLKDFTKLLIHPAYPKLKVFSSGRFSKLQLASGKLADFVFRPKDLLKYFPGLDMTPVKICHVLNVVNEELVELAQKENDLLACDKDKEEAHFAAELISFLESGVCRNIGVTKNVLSLRKVIPDINQRIADVWKLRTFMQINCIKFGLQFKGGVQEGNIAAHKELCKLMTIAHKNNKRQY